MTASNDTPTPPPAVSEWGRVGEDGTVYVKEAGGERAVGQYPEGSPQEALDFFTKRYDGLAVEVQLLEKRIRAGALAPDKAVESVNKVSALVRDAAAVGDIQALIARLDALGPLIGLQRNQRREDRARKLEESRTRKQEIVAEAETIAKGKDWRNGVTRLRDLLDEWKALPRLERNADDELWHRFSSARTTYTKARKTHFTELNEQRESAGVVKARLVKEAEALAGSTDWGPTAAKFRALMQEWKSAGGAQRDQETELWARFRAAQDAFFGARDAANAEIDREYQANADLKVKLLEEAEAILPITDLEAAKKAFRDVADRWEAIGKVPRDQIKTLEGRMRKVEQAIRALEDEKWKRSDPEKSARADSMIGQLQAAITQIEADIAAAQAKGDQNRVKKLTADLEGRKAFLEMAQKAASDFTE
ncbi:MAG TPA: DUF349 domain-containing protein [Marmoricola sp.]|nr:DUF349 domain-containing protein [Nocardioidaceae bacterium]MCB8992653.1 DUF349 domain-containing protein [Nocardioidaceae bacterium]MCO5324305.1 DUF349 domain-containing protein [Nocardioidaceae bacterium]HRV68760.1 DUF349 domain-containing protein [Marmoricola sp.]